MPTISRKITPHFWFAEKAATFYASIFPNSRVDSVTPCRPTRQADPPGL